MKPSQQGRSLICSIKESVLKSKCPKIIQSSLNSLVSTTALLPAKKHISIWSIICHLCSLTANWAALTCIISKTLEIWESLGISLQLGGCCILLRQTLLIRLSSILPMQMQLYQYNENGLQRNAYEQKNVFLALFSWWIQFKTFWFAMFKSKHTARNLHSFSHI